MIAGMLSNPYDAIYKQVQFAYDLGKVQLFFTNYCVYFGFFFMMFFTGQILSRNGLTKTNVLIQCLFLIGGIL